MTLRIYLDDCADDRRLAALLSGTPFGHQVVRAREAGIEGADDRVHFAYARTHAMVLLTYNPDDFRVLHEAEPQHPGILAVYRASRPNDMTVVDIAAAIQNLLDAGIEVENGFHVLNHWRYRPGT